MRFAVQTIRIRGMVALCGLALSATSIATIEYRLKPDINSKSVFVSITFEPHSEKSTLRIPAWCPGFYQIRRYDKSIFDLKAVNQDGELIPISSPEMRTWQIESGSSDRVTMSYRVAGDDPGLGFFGVNVRSKSAFVNGPAAFLYIDGRKSEKCTLTLDLPPNWKSATGLQDNKGTFSAADYDEFIDCPIELGEFKAFDFKVAGLPFKAVFTSPNGQYPDLTAEIEELRVLSEPALRMFGKAPFKSYTYIIHLDVGNFGGGLEHRNSTVMAVPNSDPVDLGTLAAHEFFHSWNVKQFRPKGLGPFDYTQQVRTRNLWFAEGVTEYYAQLHAYEANFNSEFALLENLSYEVDSLQSSRTRTQKTLEEICLSTWEADGFSFGDLSYYTKGTVVGLILDAAIRHATNGAKSLDDVMRLLYERHKLPNLGYEEDGIRQAVNEVALKDLSAIYDLCVRSKQDVPYQLLEKIGLQVLTPDDEHLVLGFDMREGTVTYLSEHAERHGLRTGDALLSVQKLTVASTLSDLADSVHLKLLRDGEEIDLPYPLLRERSGAYRVVRSSNPTERATRLLSGWLRKSNGESGSNLDNLWEHARTSRSGDRKAGDRSRLVRSANCGCRSRS